MEEARSLERKNSEVENLVLLSLSHDKEEISDLFTNKKINLLEKDPYM